jgi:hypoxanthine-DNA glycosylase
MWVARQTGVVARVSFPRAARIRGFPPIAGQDARVLVLGSMPSAASLAAGQYYAHVRNLFWPITGEICGFDVSVPYAERVARLRTAGMAVWDVVASCVRAGSLDSAIDERSIVVNPFAAFLDAHPRIERICFNGRKAEATWGRYVQHELSLSRPLVYRLLPSTSPANAGMPYTRKLRAWRAALAG